MGYDGHFCIRNQEVAIALVTVAQLVGALSYNRKAAGSILGQGTCLGCWLDPWSAWTIRMDPQSGRVRQATSRCFSLTQILFTFSLSLHFPPSINKYITSKICISLNTTQGQKTTPPDQPPQLEPTASQSVGYPAGVPAWHC